MVPGQVSTWINRLPLLRDTSSSLTFYFEMWSVFVTGNQFEIWQGLQAVCVFTCRKSHGMQAGSVL
jgi:hypothetical protein